jgi:hypothetical protein
MKLTTSIFCRGRRDYGAIPPLHHTSSQRGTWLINHKENLTRCSAWLRSGQQSDGVRVPVRAKVFLFSTASRPVLGSTQRPIQWLSRALSPAVKRPGREADRSPPTSAEVNNTWSYTSSPRNAHRILVGKPEGKRPLGRRRRRWVDNIKIYFREIGWDGMYGLDRSGSG